MKNLALIAVLSMFLVGCAGAPSAKIPGDKYRVPVNVMIPSELLNNETL